MTGAAMMGATTVCLMATLLAGSAHAHDGDWEAAYRRGVAARDQGRYRDAQQLLASALASAEFDELDLRRADLCEALATVDQMLGEQGEAEGLYLEAQHILAAHRDAPAALQVMVLGNLGTLRFGQGRLKEARELLERALAIGTESLGGRHPGTGTTAARLGQLEMAEGRLAEAEDLLARAAAIHAAVLPADNPDRILSQTALGELYAWQGRYAEATGVLEAVSQAAHREGEWHPRFAASLVSLADLYRLQGKRTRAAPLFERALAIYERALGSDHPSVADVLLDMSADALAERRPERAEAQVSRALQILREVHGPDHTTVAFGEYRLAEAYAQQGRLAEAEALLRHALPIQERTYPEGHHLVADCLYAVAKVQTSQRRFTDAAGSFQRAIAVYEASGGSSAGQLASALQDYARLLRKDRRAEAEALEARVKVLRARDGP